MLKNPAKNTAVAAAVLMLGACAWLQQPAAPVVEGTDNTNTNISTTYGSVIGGDSSNPYGAAPYNPDRAGIGNEGGNQPTYTPPPTTAYIPPPSPPSPGSTYIPSNAPVDINAATHTVVRGDTVYNIAKRYHITQDNLRAWNNLSEDNTIGVGQVLRVKPAGTGGPSAKPYTPPANTGASAAPMPRPPSDTAPPPVTVAEQPRKTETPPPAATVSSGTTRTVGGITWQRPTAGSIITPFGSNSKGWDIGGTMGQTVVAAADGRVVYVGSGLRGYGNMIIVQHNSMYLTAYGHNQTVLVKDQDIVKRGQSIARMGNSDTDRVKLHFELRKDGEPVNPANYLP